MTIPLYNYFPIGPLVVSPIELRKQLYAKD